MTIVDTGIYIDEIKEHAKYKGCFKELKPGRNIYEKIYNYIYENMYKRFILKHPKVFYRMFIKEQYDIEVSFLENLCSKIISDSPNKKSRKYLWIHTDVEKNNWVKYQFNEIENQQNVYGKFHKIFCVSKEVKVAFNRIFGLEEKTYVQYNPNDNYEILKRSKEQIAGTKISNKFKFISVGRFINEKGFDRLLVVHKRLIEEGYDYELWILGDGIERNSYKEFINKNNLEDTVELLGFKKKPYKFIEKCDAFVRSSRMEGYSLVVSESIILGKPIISTICSGPTELLGNGKYGLLVENSELGIYKGMKLFLDDKDKYEFYKKRSIERRVDFELSKKIKEIELILDEG